MVGEAPSAGRGVTRVAVVGCGAVAAENLMPVLAGHDGIAVTTLVDRNEARARALAQAYAVPQVLTDLDHLRRDHADGVVLATPPAHHAPATVGLAGRGFHVLVEKPMATTAADAQAMVDAADRGGVALAVGLYRRFLPSVELLRTLLGSREFGRPLAVDAEEGGPYGWPLATLDGLTRAQGGGGVLIDIGSHVLDVILHVLGATPTLESYRDNAHGGIETDCLLGAVLAPTAGDGGPVPLRLELSRTRELRGSIRVVCEHATVELLRGNFTEVLVHRSGNAAGPVQFAASWKTHGEFVGYEAFRREIDDWLAAIRLKKDPVLSGRSVVPVVRLIEEAYRAAEPLFEPGAEVPRVVAAGPVPPGDRPVVDGLTGVTGTRQTSESRPRVLITGAGGFLGGRLVEALVARGAWEPVALVREPKSAARLARYPLEIRLGDVTSRADMDRALLGIDAVVHCAVGTSWKEEESRRVTVDGTRIAAEAARAAGVRRFVHISTLFVHKRDGGATIDETTPLGPPVGDAYGRNKLAAEEAIRAVASAGLSTIVLRPTRIYGPFSKTFTTRPLAALAQGRLVVGGDPEVPANMVYVDNVVRAIERALDADDTLGGQAYLVTDPEQVPLREFYEYFARPAGLALRVSPDYQATNGHHAAGAVREWIDGLVSIARSAELRGLVRRVVYTDPVGRLARRVWESSPAMQQKLLRRFGADAAVIYRPAPTDEVEQLVYLGEPALVSGAKAARELGLTPVASREDTMAWTLAWARYARLLPPAGD